MVTLNLAVIPKCIAIFISSYVYKKYKNKEPVIRCTDNFINISKNNHWLLISSIRVDFFLYDNLM